MNMKELEARVVAFEGRIEEMSTVINAQAKALIELTEACNQVQDLSAIMETLGQELEKVRNWLGADEADGPFYPEFKSLTARVEELGAMIEGRNKSAPTKRNMTDADAIRVMTGDLKDLSHKDTAEQANLTYAQVYSCRLEYTFKHVHKQLRDENKEFKNPWVK